MRDVYLCIDDPGHGAESRLKADQVETEADEHHGAVGGGAVLGNEHRVPASLLTGGAGPGLGLQVVALAVSSPGHTTPRHRSRGSFVVTEPTILFRNVTSIKLKRRGIH